MFSPPEARALLAWLNPRAYAIVDKILARCQPADRGYDTECWEWQGPLSGAPGRGRAKGRGHSYARMNLDGQTVAVHRVMWTAVNGYLPSKKQLDHLCKNRRCVRPSHLEKTTHKQNQKRKGK
jgi:hypothetical protein